MKVQKRRRRRCSKLLQADTSVILVASVAGNTMYSQTTKRTLFVVTYCRIQKPIQIRT